MQRLAKHTSKQEEALNILGDNAKHNMLFGGSRSGKTFIALDSLCGRALIANKSRHAVLRFRFNHVKTSIVHDTFPKVMELCYPGVEYKLDKTDWFAELPNGSQIWFGGLDDKERTEKILGQEYATIYLNECSQIPYSSRNMALTRLAQKVKVEHEDRDLRLKMFYDCNPPNQAHWTYKLFIEKKDPLNRDSLKKENYSSLQMNPKDNLDNLSEDYLEELAQLPERLKKRFLDGEFASATDNALWTLETLEKWRIIKGEVPDFQRVVVAVDPSGADNEDYEGDAIGIAVVGLGTDGRGYLIEDLTIKASPKVWGNIVTTAYERHKADCIVGEKNYGGAMVEHVIQTARPNTPFKSVNATRGKQVRAEPISSLHETGKIRFLGNFPELEDELLAFTTTGYQGETSPNRADAFIWGMSELFPGMTREPNSDFDRDINVDLSFIR